jgi:hypothetical protein
MKLVQGQVWKQGDHYIRIVYLERLQVRYKTVSDLASKAGTHAQCSKKEFCRLLKGATLMPGAPTDPGVDQKPSGTAVAGSPPALS